MFLGLVVAGLLGSAVACGIFYAFSTFVMKSLGDVSPAEGMHAMQAINVRAVRPGLMSVFLGTTVVCAAVAVMAVTRWGEPGSAPAMAGALAYILGCFAVTAAGNVPLNDRLAAADAGDPEGHELWTRYLVEWTRWNHVRTAACFLSACLFLSALIPLV